MAGKQKPSSIGANVRPCETCGTAFKPRTGQRFCSRVCGGARLKKRITRVCVQCGEKKDLPASHAHRAKDFSCSQECSLAYRKANPHLRGAAISAAVKAKWATEKTWAAKQRKNKAARKRPPPIIDNEASIPFVRYPYLNAKGKRCSTCARMILDKPSATANDWFCGGVCLGKWMSVNKTGANHPRWTEDVILTCKYCEVVFPRKPIFVRKKGGHFCDESCYRAWQQSEEYDTINPHSPEFWPNAKQIIAQIKKLAHQGKCKTAIAERLELSLGQLRGFLQREQIAVTGRYKFPVGAKNPKYLKRVDVECSTCGLIKPRAPWLVREGPMYCSDKCRARGKYLGGAIKSRGPSWTNQRALARAADEDTCQLCGAYKGQSICVHHLKPFRFYKNSAAANRFSNLICLCRSCHLKVEGTTDKANRDNWRQHYEKVAKQRLQRKKKPAIRC